MGYPFQPFLRIYRRRFSTPCSLCCRRVSTLLEVLPWPHFKMFMPRSHMKLFQPFLRFYEGVGRGGAWEVVYIAVSTLLEILLAV